MTLRIGSAIGGPFALWAAVWGIMIPQHTGARLVILAALAGVVVGAGAAATTTLFLRYTKGRWPALAGLLVAQCGVTLFLALGLLYGMTRWPAPGRWRPLPPAPERVVRLEGPDCADGMPPVIAVRTRTGRRYWLTDSGSARTWEPEEKRTANGGEPYRQCWRTQDGVRQPGYPTPPRPPAQLHRVRLQGVDCGGFAAYLLTQDGDLWEWDVFSCAIGAMIAFVGTGAMVLLLGVWAFALTIFSTEGRAWRARSAAVMHSAA